METELKFQVPPRQRSALQRAMATPRVQRTRLQAVYADTPDGRLAAAGLALRLRQEGRVWVQTLKGRGDGLIQRMEHEVPVRPASPGRRAGPPALDPARHDGTPAGVALQQALQGAAPLQPVYRTDIQRLHRRVRHGGALIELAYDRGRILAGGQALAVDEIEFELISGPPAALADLAARWAQRFDLWWDVRTKSERGHRLALGLAQVPAVQATPMQMPQQLGRDAAWGAMLWAALAHALPNAAELAAGSATPEHLHQLRVALRRLRTVLGALAHWSPDEAAARALQADWRAPFGALGRSRDADVRAELLARLMADVQGPPLPEEPADPGPEPGAVVRDPAFTVLLLRCAQMGLAAAAPAPAGTAAGDPASEQALPRQAAQQVQLMLRRARADAKAFVQAPAERQHRMRKRFKRLRHALEFLMPLLPASTAKRCQRLQRALLPLLRALGLLNDLHLARLHWQEQPGPAAGFAAGLCAGSRAAALRRAGRRLKRLRAVLQADKGRRR